MMYRRLNKHFAVFVILVLCFQIFVPQLKTYAQPKNNVVNTAYQLKENEAIASTFAELKTHLSQQNAIDTVYLAADIQIPIGGIVVHSSKTKFEINGINPNDETQTRHTISDYSSAVTTDAIQINASSAVTQATLKDIIITGRNYYGTITVSDSKKNCKLVYDNITYTGPQVAVNRYGTVEIINSNIKIVSGNGGSPPQEVAQATHMVLSGDITIDHQGTTRIFWLEVQKGSLTVTANANVTVTSATMSMLYGYDCDFTVEENATFSYTAKQIFNENNIVNFNVKENANVFINTSAYYAQGVVMVTGTFNVQSNATFHAIAKGGAKAVIHAKNGPALSFDNPKSVLIYNATVRPFHYSATSGTLSIQAKQINYWNSTGTGGFDDLPPVSYKKADKRNFTLSGTVTIGDNGNITNLASNYQEGDPTTAPSATDFHLGSSARVLAFGSLDISVDPPHTPAYFITGKGDPGAEVRLRYTDNSGSSAAVSATINKQGTFTAEIDKYVKDQTEITAKATLNFLYAETAVTANYGDITFTNIPHTLAFETIPIPQKQQLVKRKDPNFAITVSDNRIAGTPWALTVRLIRPFTAEDSNIPQIENGLVYVNESGNMFFLNAETATTVYTQNTPAQGNFTVKWDKDKGVLAYINPNRVYANTQYTATIEWNISLTP